MSYFPEDITRIINSFLPYSDKVAFSETCRDMHAIYKEAAHEVVVPYCNRIDTDTLYSLYHNHKVVNCDDLKIVLMNRGKIKVYQAVVADQNPINWHSVPSALIRAILLRYDEILMEFLATNPECVAICEDLKKYLETLDKKKFKYMRINGRIV